MVNKCMNCGAALRYDIALGRLKCDNCDSTFSGDTYAYGTDAHENQNMAPYDSRDQYMATVFTCPNCRAQLAVSARSEYGADYEANL